HLLRQAGNTRIPARSPRAGREWVRSLTNCFRRHVKTDPVRAFATAVLVQLKLVELNLGEAEGDGLHGAVTVSAVVKAGNDGIRQDVLHVLLLISGGALSLCRGDVDRRLLALARGRAFEQASRRRVQRLGHGDLAKRDAVRDTVSPRTFDAAGGAPLEASEFHPARGPRVRGGYASRLRGPVKHQGNQRILPRKK